MRGQLRRQRLLRRLYVLGRTRRVQEHRRALIAHPLQEPDQLSHHTPEGRLEWWRAHRKRVGVVAERDIGQAGKERPVLVAIDRQDRTAKREQVVGKARPEAGTPRGQGLLKEAALLVDAVPRTNVGRGRQEQEDGGCLDAVGDLLREIARTPQLVGIDPDVGLDAQALLDRRLQPVEHAIDPVAIISVRVADEDIVVVPGYVGHWLPECSTNLHRSSHAPSPASHDDDRLGISDPRLS